MKAMRTLVILLIFVLAGCAPVISREALKGVDQDVTFEMVLESPDRHTGKTILVGGDIIEAQPLPGKTRIVVLQRPLGYRNKPSKDGESRGRFIVEAAGFLDPAIYSAGRPLTVVGIVMGKQVRPLGKMEYAYPIIAKKELYLWPREETVNQPRFHFGIGVWKSF